MNDKRKVLPGDEVAEAEEYLPAEGTYEENGKVFSALKGILELDDKEKVAKVVAENPMVTLTIGDEVFAEITDVRASMAIADGTIHVSKLSQEYVQDVGREVRPSDIIRAKVTQVKPSVQLTTQGAHYGVVKALCRKCRQPLLKVEKGLYCNTCERSDIRKMADDYGDVESV
jgi:exosome complex component CSL4